MQLRYRGVILTCDTDIPEDEAKAYIDYNLEKHGPALESVDVHIDGDYADMHYKLSEMPFERIRRITGYLVGTLDRFNDAKRAEESMRVKHKVNPA